MAFSAPQPGDAPTTSDGTAPTSPVDQHRPTPLMAVLGAGDAAVAAVARAFADAYAAAATRRETLQHRVAELPAELEGLRARFSGDELRRALETYRAQVERAYAEFAGRGEEAWEKLRIDEAQEAASRALAAAGRQSRFAGERVAKAGQRFSGRAADVVVDASAATADAVEDAGTAAAGVIEDAGDEAATATRKATGSSGTTAGRPAPKRTPRRPASS